MEALIVPGDELISLPLSPQFEHLTAPAFMSSLFHEVLVRTNSPEEAREAVRIAATVLAQLTDAAPTPENTTP